jgi:hypothetical protein
MDNYDGSSPTVTNCTFSGNEAGMGGGGMYNEDWSSPTVTNCSFAGNFFNGMRSGYNSHPIASNCIFWNNVGDQVVYFSGSTSAVSYSNVQDGYPGMGNINSDPMCVDPANGNLRLSPGSPCIDAASNTAVPVGITTDIDGYPRFVDDPDSDDCWQAPGTCGDPPVVDMGACEYQTGCPWDCGMPADGQVSIVDFLAMLGQWGISGTCDFDGGGVGVTDFLLLLGAWGVCP